MMLGKHAVDIHVQGASARFVVLRVSKSDIDTSFHQFTHNRIVTAISADTIPTEHNNAPKKALAQELDQPLKFRALNAVLNDAGVRYGNVGVLFEPGMTFGN